MSAATALTLVQTRDARSPDLAEFVTVLENHWPALDIARRRADDDGPPYMDIGDGFRFQGLPADTKLPPFLDVLAADLEPPAEDFRDLLARMALTDEVRLYVAAPCPYCARAVRRWAALAWAGPQLRVRVVDVTLFPEEASRDNIKAVPTLVLDGNWRWSGNIPVADVLQQLVSRDPAQLSRTALEGLVKEGQASTLAKAMQAHGAIFPAFVELLTHSQWPLRLGAMVAMEALIESDPDLARTVVPEVMARFPAMDEAAQGDALYILGEAGDQETLSLLQTIPLDGAGSELQQAAHEAAARISARLAETERSS
jgi:hypothetical protein